MTIIPFFIAGFFYSAWPWGFAVGAALGLFPLVANSDRYAHVWRDRKGAYIQSAISAIALSAVIHGGAMALANGIHWLIGP